LTSLIAKLREANVLDLSQVRAIILETTGDIPVVKLGQKRFICKNKAFDMMLGIILGSVLSRAITGNDPIFPTIGAGMILVGIHSKKDLEMALYTNGKVIDFNQVKVARFERSGDISVIPREKQKKVSVTEITVREGVQTVRLELSEDA
jgi:uncharacterized membrane protein YcaP (DUF421 family)